MRVWQLNSGPEGRSYAEVLLRYGVALVGPGEIGSCARLSAPQLPGHLSRFAREVSEGDAILLRVGRTTVTAVGEVVSGYQYLPQFDDVGGMDLSHGRRVRWYPFSTEQSAHHGIPAGGAVPFAPAPEALRPLAESALRPDLRAWQPQELPPLPPEEPIVEHGRRAVRNVVAEACDLWSIYSDLAQQQEAPSESELVSHFVVPLLRALGWRPELIAVEWRSTDVALFRQLPRVREHLVLLLEAKRVGAISDGALRQARDYLESMDAVCDVVVTDGFTYRRYQAECDYEPSGYANLVRLRVQGVSLLDRLSPAHLCGEGI